MNKKSCLTFVVLLIFTKLINAADYYVALNGDNSNSGSENSPFRTIQKAANVMIAGDTCYIRSGTYRETVTILTNNLSFQAYNNDTVIVSGADLVTGWIQHSGNIYKTSFSGMEPEFTQVFYMGKHQQMARYPDNIKGNMLSIADDCGYASLEVKNNGKVTFDVAPPGGTNFWAGGYFRAISGLTWMNPMGKITASSGKDLTCEMISKTWIEGNDNTTGPGKGYIFHLNALTMAGEWYLQDNTLYFWKPGGGIPGDTEVEAQKRNLAFILDDRSHITLKNLHIKAASVRMNNTSNCVIEGCSFRYQKGWYTRRLYHWSHTEHGGVYVKGDNNTFNACYFYGTWGNLLNFKDGQNNTVENCIFDNNGWMSMFTSCIQTDCYNLTVENSTFGSTGRFHIRSDEKFNVRHSDFYDCMKVGQDAGSLQVTNGGSYGNPVELDGAEIAYNKFHDMNTLVADVYNKNFVVAIYFEGATDYTVHHNLAYNIKTRYDQGSFVYLGPRKCHIQDIFYYNNTAWNVDRIVGVWNRDGEGEITNGRFINNIFDSRARVDWGSPSLEAGITWANNLSSADNNIFADVNNRNYELSDGSQAIDYGDTIPGITDGYNGPAPDAGCFEKGNTPWTAGATMAIPGFPEDDLVSLTVLSGSGDGYFTEGIEVTITADTIVGKEFIVWTGDTAYLANPDEPLTTLTMPANNVRVTATYRDTIFNLTIGSGSGDGIYSEGTEVTITADTIAGKEFVSWTGDIAYLANVGESPTTLTMPSKAVTVTATYRDTTFQLTVNSGSGNGIYSEGNEVTVEADTIEGKEFVAWEGDTAYLADPGESPTTLTMPAKDVTVTATYEDISTNIFTAEYDKNGRYFILFPNPNADNLLNISIIDPEETYVNIRICGMDGSLRIRQQIQTHTQGKIYVGDLAPGLYLVKAGPNIQKLIIQ